MSEILDKTDTENAVTHGASTSSKTIWIVDFENSADIKDPLNMSRTRKWSITVIMSACGTSLTAASGMAPSTYPGMEAVFGSTRIVNTLSVTLFVWGMAIGPMISGPLSDVTGRRKVMTASSTLFFLFNVPVAFDIGMHLTFRFISGLVGSTSAAVAGAVISDIFPNRSVGLPMMIFTTTILVGPIVGVVLSAIINANADWRWTWYTLIIWSFVMMVLVWGFVPETSRRQILDEKAALLRRETAEARWLGPGECENRSIGPALKVALSVPFQLLLREPMILLLNLWTSVLLGILYLSFSGIPLVFKRQFGFTNLQSGLAFLGFGVGEILAGASQPIFSAIYLRRIKANGGQATPEMRLRPGQVGAVLAPLGLLLLGLTSFSDVPWIIPILVSTFFGAGLILAMSSTWTYLVDAYRPVAASAMSANNFMRAMFAGAFPLFGTQLYETLGAVGATCLLAGLMALAIPLPFVFERVGARIRQKSRFSTVAV